MTDALPTLKEADALRADIYRLLATLLRQPPDTELLSWLAELAIEQDGSRLAECWQSLAVAANGGTAASSLSPLGRCDSRRGCALCLLVPQRRIDGSGAGGAAPRPKSARL